MYLRNFNENGEYSYVGEHINVHGSSNFPVEERRFWGLPRLHNSTGTYHAGC